MASYRPVNCDFWSDPDIEKMSPEEKLFYIFLFTNQRTSESEIYGISVKYMSEMINLPTLKINNLLKSLESAYHKITYDHEKEIIFVHSFMKWNQRGRPEFIKKSIENDVEKSPSEKLWQKWCILYKNHNTVKVVQTRFASCLALPCLESVIKTETPKEEGPGETKKEEPEKYKAEIDEILSFFNSTCNSQYRTINKEIVGMITARLDEKYTVAAFKRVIEYKYKQWVVDEKMRPYIRPSTLFRPTKFPEYLSETTMQKHDERIPHTDISKLRY